MIKVNDKDLDMILFPDGTPLLRLPVTEYFQTMPINNVLKDLSATDKPVIITWKYDSDAEFLRVNYIVNHLRSKGIQHIHLYMPYIPNARFDRVKKEDEIFTLKYFANLINDMNFDSVTALDPHSYVSEALIDNLKVIEPTDYIFKVLSDIPDHDNLMLYFPDEGAMKRYSHMTEKFHLPFAFGIKKRDWRNGNIIGIEIAGLTEDITDKQVLIVDDICSKGGTFYYAAKALKEINAGDIYLYISHCENAILEGNLINSNLVKTIFTTDSIYREEHPLIKVVNNW